MSLPFPSAINAVHALLLRNKDEKAIDKLERELNAPLAGETMKDAQSEADGPWSDKAQGSAFLAAMQTQEA